MNWKDFFYFSQRERRGIVLLLVLIAGIFIGKWIFQPKEKTLIQTSENQAVQNEIAAENPYVPLFEQQETKPRKTYPHRESAPQQRTYYDRKEEKPERPLQQNFPKIEKLTEGTTLELNSADTTDLVKIPGIGPAFARRIVAYRDRLGGYHRVEQLQEVYGMYEELYVRILPFLQIDAQNIKPIYVNRFSLDRLKNHPYLNFYQAKAILEIRKKKGTISSVEELKLLEEFTDDDWIRILPYFSLE